MSRPDYYGNPAGVTGDIDVVRGIYAAFAARDLDAAVELLSEDCRLHLVGTAALVGRTEAYRGHGGMRQYFADVRRTWEDLVLYAEDFRAIPGAVVVMGHVEGRRGGEAVPAAPCGRGRCRPAGPPRSAWRTPAPRVDSAAGVRQRRDHRRPDLRGSTRWPSRSPWEIAA